MLYNKAKTLIEMKKNYFFCAMLFAMAASTSAQDIQFTENNIALGNMEGPEMAFSDVDNDGDQDLYVTGYNLDAEGGETLTGHLYINDGDGNFVESTETSFVGGFRTLEFIDIDGDGDEDLFSTVDYDGTKVQLYINDGNGVFTDQVTTAFDGVVGSTFEFADIDGDDDPDLIIANDENFGGATRLYINDGSGVFTEDTAAGLAGIKFGDISCADLDGDDDMDLVISGVTIGNTKLLEAYINDGSGDFTNISFSIFSDDYADIEFTDIDNDGDMDMITSEFDHYTIKVYENNGIGIYSEVTANSFTELSNRDFRVLDIDNDNDMDIVIAGINQSVFGMPAQTIIYQNDGAGVFTEATGTGIIGFSGNTAFEFADVNNDGGIDLVVKDLDQQRLYMNSSPGLEIVEDKFAQAFQVYPNPTSGTLNLQFETTQETLQLNLTDISGKQIARVNYTDVQSVEYDLNQATGMYFLELVSGEQHAVIKLMKQ